MVARAIRLVGGRDEGWSYRWGCWIFLGYGVFSTIGAEPWRGFNRNLALSFTSLHKSRLARWSNHICSCTPRSQLELSNQKLVSRAEDVCQHSGWSRSTQHYLSSSEIIGRLAAAAVDYLSRRREVMYHEDNKKSNWFQATFWEFILISPFGLD